MAIGIKVQPYEGMPAQCSAFAYVLLCCCVYVCTIQTLVAEIVVGRYRRPKLVLFVDSFVVVVIGVAVVASCIVRHSASAIYFVAALCIDKCCCWLLLLVAAAFVQSDRVHDSSDATHTHTEMKIGDISGAAFDAHL